MRIRKIARRFIVFKWMFNRWRGTGISLYKTFFFNISAFDIRTALKFPVWIYQGTKIEHVGIIILNAPICSGMVRIGKRQFFRNSITSIINIGTMVFDGNCTILGGTIIHVLGEKSLIHFGKENMIGENSQILVGSRIDIGDFSRIAFGTLIVSADFHYVINVTTGNVTRSFAPIKIGRYNWIGNNSVIKKGTVTPDYCIVSNGSMLSKDFSNEPLYTLIVGVPGRVKGYGYRRIYNDKSNAELDEFFNISDSDHKQITLDPLDLSYNWFCDGEIHVH